MSSNLMSKAKTILLQRCRAGGFITPAMDVEQPDIPYGTAIGPLLPIQAREINLVPRSRPLLRPQLVQQGVEQRSRQLGADRQIPPVIEGKRAALDRILLGHQQRLCWQSTPPAHPDRRGDDRRRRLLIQLIAEPFQGGKEAGADDRSQPTHRPAPTRGRQAVHRRAPGRGVSATSCMGYSPLPGSPPLQMMASTRLRRVTGSRSGPIGSRQALPKRRAPSTTTSSMSRASP